MSPKSIFPMTQSLSLIFVVINVAQSSCQSFPNSRVRNTFPEGGVVIEASSLPLRHAETDAGGLSGDASI